MFQKKKGFTLIELLAVIVILAVIALIATPLIMNVINDAKKNSFKDSAYGIVKAVELRVAKEAMSDGPTTRFKIDVTTDAIDYSGDKPTKGWALAEKDGSITLYMYNDSYCAYKVNTDKEITVTDNQEEIGACKEEMNKIKDERFIIELTAAGRTGRERPVNNCTFDGELVQGAEYVDGQYTYRYKQDASGASSWSNMTADGWGVMLTDKNSTDPVTTKLCTSINGKPIVSMQAMFLQSKTSEIDFSTFDTSNVTNMQAMFNSAKELTSLDISSFDTSKGVDLSAAFMGCSGLQSINLDNLKLSQVPGSMLSGTSSLKTISAKNWKIPNTFTNGFFRTMAGGKSIETIDVTGWDLSSTTDISGLFASSGGLKRIIGLDTWDTSNITNMYALFQLDTALTALDLSSFDTSNVTNMEIMFWGDSSLTTLDLSNFNISKAITMTGMFSNMTNLESLNLSNWDFGKLNLHTGNEYLQDVLGLIYDNNLKTLNMSNTRYSSSMYKAFGGLRSLETLILTNIHTSNVTNMSYMFQDDEKLTHLDLSDFDTSNVVNMQGMFQNMKKITSLDLSSFNTSEVTNMGNMFLWDGELTTIKVNEKFTTNKVTYSDTMFYECKKLKGGAGTTYQESHATSEYAHIDGGSSNPGYFTN